MRFTQVKLHTGDLERLSVFYVDALDCEVLLEPTVLDEPVSHGVGAYGARVEIAVLALPGVSEDLTLELINVEGEPRSGDGLLTFYVDDVDATAQRVVDAGGAFKGDIVEIKGPSGHISRFVFMTDPEGNVIDLLTRV